VEFARPWRASAQDVTTPTAERPPAADLPAAGARGQAEWRSVDGRRALPIALFLLFAVPLVVALVSLAHPRWYPLLDMAWTEMRLRDVWSSHPPLLGLAGRIGPLGHQGSHPGPLSFYVLWPFYELAGASAWAMEFASVAVHLLAIGCLLWIANRRAGPGLVLGIGAALAVLLHGFGPVLLTQAWNPYLPVLWWLVFLLAVWSVIDGDLALLPLAVFAGSLCAQTEVAYLGLTVGLGAAALVYVGVDTYRRRQQAGVVRRFALWAGAAVVVAVLVWIPPVVEQLTTDHGNLGVLFDYFRHPPQSPVGLSQGAKVLLAHLNPVTPVAKALVPTTSHVDVTTGSVVPGAFFLALWAASVVVAWRLRLRSLLGLDAVVAGTVLLGVLSISRIFGVLWYYLVLWAWGVDVLMVIAVGWAVVAAVGRRLGPGRRRQAATAGGLALAAFTVVLTALFAIDAASVEFPTPRLSATLGAVVTPTARALDHHVGPSTGHAGRYLVTFGDPASLGAQGFGLINELERLGYDVGAPAGYRGPVTPHRVRLPADATAVVHLSIGTDIPYWQSKPEARQLASFDPRSARDRAEYARLHAAIVRELQAAGLSDLVAGVDGELFATTLDPRLPATPRRQLARLADLGLPAAVFVAPPSERG
jgi:hypothetical protein